MEVTSGDSLLARIGPAIRPSAGPLVAFIGGDAAAEHLAESVAIGPLVPHDRDVLPGRWIACPRLLVIQSSCGRSAGPWRHLGSPYAADRAVQLRRLVEAARSRGIPVVLWRDGPSWQCDHAVADLGPLREFNGSVSEAAVFLRHAAEGEAP